MANALYPKAKESLLSQNPSIDLDTDTIKAVLVTSAYVYSAAHQYHSELAGVVATSAGLAGKSIALGVFDADNLTFSAVGSGSTVAAIVLFKDTGVSATSPLIAYLDTGSNLPIPTNGGDIVIAWSDGASKIFAL